MTIADSVGIVVIGRNEGEYLNSSLQSALSITSNIVYVDSGSTDNSLEIASKLGVLVFELDISIPFTAARAYNAGVESLLKLSADIEFVQFLDGDAQLAPGWVEAAYQTICQDSRVSVVCGRRRERYPNRSVYNLLADMEWDTPIGEVDECGPEAMMRVSHFMVINGFNESLIAGEEPEICFRLRQIGGKVLRIDADASQHDMNMFTLQQWWRRSRRGGYAFAEEAWIHRKSPGAYRVRQSLRIWFWVLFLPLTVIILLPFSQGMSLLLLPLGYGLGVFKTFRWAQREKQYTTRKGLIFSCFCLLIKFPEWHGQVEFILLKMLNRRREIIEYKVTSCSESG